MRALAASILAAVAVLALLCGSAQGKALRVYTCTTPDGRLLGPTIDVSQRASGWMWSYTGGVWPVMIDQCPTHGGFTVDIRNGASTAGAGAFARWTAAPGTVLTAVSMRLASDMTNNPANGQGTFSISVATNAQTILARNSPGSVIADGPGSNVQTTLVPATWLEIRLACLDQCAPGDDGFSVTNAWFDVDDPSPPVGGLTGSAVDAQTWWGIVRFGLNAADVGSGLYRAVVEVDGADALAMPISDPGGYCRDIGPSAAVNEFAAAQPCLLRVDAGTLDVDSAKLPQGRHSVRVLLEDAAGNRTPIFGPVVRSISASGAIGPGSDPALRGAANGDGASDQARLTAHWGSRGSRTRLVSAFGKPHVLRGRLTGPDGAPISRATIDVISRTTAVNARELAKRNGPVTGSDGRWRLELPRGVSSRALTFRYRSHMNDTVPAAEATVQLRVRAGLQLSIRPRIARRGQAIRFSGRLLGGPLPRGGKQIVLMARASRGAWVRFNVIRTDGAGRFKTIYRFQQPGAAVYRFRALSLAEAAYPYAAGGSNIVRVRKR